MNDPEAPTSGLIPGSPQAIRQERIRRERAKTCEFSAKIASGLFLIVSACMIIANAASKICPSAIKTWYICYCTSIIVAAATFSGVTVYKWMEKIDDFKYAMQIGALFAVGYIVFTISGAAVFFTTPNDKRCNPSLYGNIFFTVVANIVISAIMCLAVAGRILYLKKCAIN